MIELPIRKDGDELRVRDAAGAIFKGVVGDVQANGTFQLRLPAGHRVGSADSEPRRAGVWCFYREELSDFGLTILGPWAAPATAPFNIIAADYGKIVVDTGAGFEVYSREAA